MAGMTLPVFLATTALLFLLMEFYGISLQWTWPALFLAIGAVKLLQRRTPDKTHIPGGYGLVPTSADELPPRTGPAVAAQPSRSGGQAADAGA